MEERLKEQIKENLLKDDEIKKIDTILFKRKNLDYNVYEFLLKLFGDIDNVKEYIFKNYKGSYIRRSFYSVFASLLMKYKDKFSLQEIKEMLITIEKRVDLLHS